MGFHFMQIFDISVFNFINHILSSQPLNFIMPLVSRFGGGELYFMVGVVLLFSKKREDKMLGIFLIAGLTISYYIVSLLKILIARPRPFIVLTNVILLGPAEKTPSFPSNHAVTAFMTASLLAWRFKNYILFYLLALVVAFSRVYIGVHYPSDVLAGAIIGIMIGLFLKRVSRLLETNG
jgi:undecaprenyl-diphosphatase